MNAIPDILKKILAHKAREVYARSQNVPLKTLRKRVEAAPTARGFADAIERRIQSGQSAVIAEIKKASPSKGLLRVDFNAAAIAKTYAEHGATCLSVLTDSEFFQGTDEDLQAARAICPLPVLRKDFMIDAYQVFEARALGADCILLIVAALGDAHLLELSDLAHDMGMDVLVEVHDAHELERALALNTVLIGVNNRDLRTFDTQLEITLNLLGRIPNDRIVVTESGIHAAIDIQKMRAHGVHAFLIGEGFMRAPDPGKRLAELFGEQK